MQCQRRVAEPARIAVVLLTLALSACASTGIVPADRDTFIVSERGPTVGFSPPIRQTASVYRQANEFCAKQNKQVETVKLDQLDSGLGRPASASLQFRCMPK
jgi:hypothetical protein